MDLAGDIRMIPWRNGPYAHLRAMMLLQAARRADEVARAQGYSRACPVYWIYLQAVDPECARREREAPR